jgi:hypothetical protein
MISSGICKSRQFVETALNGLERPSISESVGVADEVTEPEHGGTDERGEEPVHRGAMLRYCTADV